MKIGNFEIFPKPGKGELVLLILFLSSPFLFMIMVLAVFKFKESGTAGLIELTNFIFDLLAHFMT